MNFPTELDQIKERIDQIDPVAYGKTRNFLDGDVTYLSPYISRGVVSTKQIMESVLARGYEPKQIGKFQQELAWRDYWQQVWIAKQDLINHDLKHEQSEVAHHELPQAIEQAETGIYVMDQGIRELYETGYMHNHLRMYTGAIACNMAKSHWKIPAQWMYFHLLDSDWASNALSWQWVAGSNANKKYVANQENINKYCRSDQKGTFLDVPYEALDGMEIPIQLQETMIPTLRTPLPDSEEIQLNEELPVLIYNWYNLDPYWKKDEAANRILLLEPSTFKKYPISSKSIDFALALSKNIPGVQLYVGEFKELASHVKSQSIFYKEHPLNKNYMGTEESRDWIFPVTGYFPSFFGFWKKCKKSLK